jgi:hypothetical protein
MDKQKMITHSKITAGLVVVAAAAGWIYFASGEKINSYFIEKGAALEESKLDNLRKYNFTVLDGGSTARVEMLIRAVGICESKGMKTEITRLSILHRKESSATLTISCNLSTSK